MPTSTSVAPAFRYTSYPVTPTLSVEAVHDSDAPDEVIDPAVGVPGLDGAVVSGVPPPPLRSP